jgi:hypothetical protein
VGRVDRVKSAARILRNAWGVVLVFTCAPVVALYAVYADGWVSKLCVAVLALATWVAMVTEWAEAKFGPNP